MALRIAICGIHIESSTFTPYTSEVNDFQITSGESLLHRYYWRGEDWASDVDWIPLFHARALPGGVVDPVAYATWKARILQGLQEATEETPLDAVFFDIHGAMSVVGLDDAEGDLINAIRCVIGSSPLVSASMDLHGNVSHDLFNGCDLLTCYRMAPHEDQEESTRRAAYNLVDCLKSGRGKPIKALAHVPILLPGEKTSTRVEPAKSLYAQIDQVEKQPGILDAAIWIGFAWADQKRCQGAVVVTGYDVGEVTEQAHRLAAHFWSVRREFEFVAPVGSIEECLEAAVSGPTPYFISDSGDNPGAGGADDVTVALHAILNWDAAKGGTHKVLHASIVDPAAASHCWKSGVGAEVSIELGGKIDSREPGPISLAGEVVSLFDDPRGGPTAVIRCGTVWVIVTTNRNQYHSRSQYEALGLTIEDFDVVVVKIGYLEPDLFAAQQGWMMALTPGGVDQDLIRLGHHKIRRPMYPFDPDMELDSHHVEVVIP